MLCSWLDHASLLNPDTPDVADDKEKVKEAVGQDHRQALDGEDALGLCNEHGGNGEANKILQNTQGEQNARDDVMGYDGTLLIVALEHVLPAKDHGQDRDPGDHKGQGPE